MSTVAYITALTIGVAGVAAVAANATEEVSAPVVAKAPAVVVDPLDKFRGAKTLTQDELIELLSAVGFKGKALRTAWAVAMKESNGRPVAHNKTVSTGDNSYGIFQINMIGSLGKDRLALFNEKFGMLKPTELFDPVTNVQVVYYMTQGGTDWSSWGLGPNAYDGTPGEHLITKWEKQFPKSTTKG
jgi:uncharacterized membrane protein (DUF2068 family)